MEIQNSVKLSEPVGNWKFEIQNNVYSLEPVGIVPLLHWGGLARDHDELYQES